MACNKNGGRRFVGAGMHKGRERVLERRCGVDAAKDGTGTATPSNLKSSYVNCTTLSSRVGMTLVEVMLAILILGIGLTGLVATTSRCLAVARKAKNYENARRLLGELELTNEELFTNDFEPEDSFSVSFPHPYDGYKGDVRIEPVFDDDEEYPLYKITLTITWSEKGKANKEEVVTYRYAPEVVEE